MDHSLDNDENKLKRNWKGRKWQKQMQELFNFSLAKEGAKKCFNIFFLIIYLLDDFATSLSSVSLFTFKYL